MDTGDGHRFSLLDKKPVYAILLIFKQVKHQYNLKYFSYQHHYNNEHYISKFLASTQSPIAFSFVCYLPKFTFWQVCSLVVFVCLSVCLLLAKIYILASMFVGRVCLSVCLSVITCQNLHFGKYVRWSFFLTVCLFICLFVRKFHKISRTTQSVITKLGHKQALIHDSCKFIGQEYRSNN